MLKKLFLFSFLCMSLSADQVEVISNGVSSIEYYNEIFEKNHIDANAVEAHVDQFGKEFKKNRSILSKWMRKLSLENSNPIPFKKDVRKLVLMNIPVHFYRDHHVAKLPQEKMVLFMWEPVIRLRKMYNPKLHRCFSKIYTWDDELVDNERYFKFFYPVLQPMISSVIPFEEKKFCTLISGCVHNAHTFSRKYPNELYTQRIQAIEFFEKMGEEGFEFYGRGWGNTSYKTYRGPCADKLDVLKNYRFSICYENCRDVPGYITEKIFDCFAAGNVPIYWGANNVSDYIPSDCFIDRRNFATMDDLYAFLKTMSQHEYEGYLIRIKTFLQSEQAQLFSKENFEKTFLEAIAEK